jgi:integrase/recombinase XerD
VDVGVPSPVQAWLAHLAAQGRSARTVDGYRRDLLDYLRWLGRDPLGASRRDVEAYALAMHRAGLAPRTRARRLAAVRAFYRWAVSQGVVADDPARFVSPPRLPRGTPRFLLPAEVQALLAACRRDDPRGVRDRAAVELGLHGLRAGEVVSLDLDDLVYLERGQLRVRRKGSAVRLVELAPRAQAALRAWLEERPRCPSPALFVPIPPRRPYRLTVRQLQARFRALARRAGIERMISFHSLRHTLGTALADAAVPLQEIQDLLGHASPATTRVYAQVARHRLRDALHAGLEALGLEPGRR